MYDKLAKFSLAKLEKFIPGLHCSLHYQ